MVSGTPGDLDPGTVDRPVVAFDLGAEEKGHNLTNFCYNRADEATALENRSESQLQTSAVSVRQGEVMPSCLKT
jgi:hypothetical protein